MILISKISNCNVGSISGHLSKVVGLIKVKDLKAAIVHLDRHVPHPIINALHGEVYRIEKEAARPTGHRDFGRVALRGIDGWDVSDDVRICAFEKIQAVLAQLIPDIPKTENELNREALLERYKSQAIDVQALADLQQDVKRLQESWETCDKLGEIHARAEAVFPNFAALCKFERVDPSNYGQSAALLVAAYCRKYPFLDFYFEPLQTLLEADVNAEYDNLDKKRSFASEELKKHTSICQKPENSSLNGFDNVRIFDATLLPLKSGRYINANLVSLMGSRYIATQAPLKDSVQDFWQMVLEQKPPTIVAVNESFDDQSAVISYCPNEVGEVKRFGDITIQLKEPIVTESQADWRLLGHAKTDGFKQRKLIVTKGDLVHEVNHFQYLHWADGSYPQERCILRLIELVAQSQGTNENPLVVHCRAGVGRAGLFMVLYDQFMRLKANLPIDVKAIVSDLRDPAKGRSRSMVANLSQYQFAYYFLQKAILSRFG